ncbi:polysaccharide biosynthesis tyrosine autokinase [Geothrix fuzhouensis]|uniref:polysaccharide biosynthesis tyrosine autokinase n=1 Tax=Geothrix fuzhouensis TaxID=2966451 RepID=UPI002148D5F3|nr:polysaccharide biosynthesis tyrosine autokinase [Geothrix fuzhouensis]
MSPTDQSSDPVAWDLREPEGGGQTSLGEHIATLWEGRYLILGATLLALLLGGYYAWRKSPVYQVDAMLQVEDKKGGKGGPGMEALSSLLDQPTVAQAEIEILKSNLVLGRTVEAQALDIVAQPTFNPLVGDALVRRRADAPSLRIERFELPTPLRGTHFRLIAEANGTFRWEDPDGQVLATGHEGEELKAVWQGQPLVLQVRHLVAPPGQRFSLTRQPFLQAIEDLRQGLQVAEKGRQTNILGLSFEHRSPDRGAEILNEIVAQYVRQNIERKAEEASKTLAFLQEQLPQLKAKLEAAENQLNQYRMQAGSVDLPEEAKLVLKQSVDLESQMLALKQKKQELLRTYKQRADVVENLDDQLTKLSAEARQIDGRVRGLPRTQQELVRLMRDVQVDTDMYTALLNNAQQLQVAKAGEIGNARIVDSAMPSLKPVRPQKNTIITLAALGGMIVGIGLIGLRRVLHRGVEDPRLIESRLGLPVVVTVPHSDQQAAIHKAMERREGGLHLLAQAHPDDLAVESLRSLRTSLHFTMMDAKNPVVLITGPAPTIGKTFLSANFAALLAQSGTRVLVVDGDLRKGLLHRPFGLLERGEGLSEILSGKADWKAVLHPEVVPGLDLITTGTLPPNPAELLMTSRLPDFLQQVSAAYDLILIDAAPVLAVTDPVILAKNVGTVLLIAKARAHSLEELQIALQRFESGGVKVNGCIFNDVTAIKVGYQYYRYAYHYTYKNQGKDKP